MSAAEVAAFIGACGAGWFLLGVGLIRWTKDAKGWGVLMLFVGVAFMAAAGNLS